MTSAQVVVRFDPVENRHRVTCTACRFDTSTSSAVLAKDLRDTHKARHRKAAIDAGRKARVR